MKLGRWVPNAGYMMYMPIGEAADRTFLCKYVVLLVDPLLATIVW